MRLILAILLCCAASGAAAQTTLGCDKGQALIVEDAMRNAKAITLRAAVAVGDTPEYSRWFGAYTPAQAEEVRATLKGVMSAIRSGRVVAQCLSASEDGCADGEYAWVYAHRPFQVHLCPPFFDLPPLAALRPGERRSDNGTREGTIVHEISHFRRVGDTEDHCYSRDVCADMAQDDPAQAIENADSYQYFAEDVTYYGRQPLADKPSP